MSDYGGGVLPKHAIYPSPKLVLREVEFVKYVWLQSGYWQN